MGYFAGARDLRNLLAVAVVLRRLAEDSLYRADRSLYLTTAEALEARARRMAGELPGEMDEPDAHRPVDIHI